MSKIIILEKIKIKEILISEDKDSFVIQAVYVFLTAENEEYGTPKRATFKDFPKDDIDKIKNVFNIFEGQINNIEKL